MLRFESAPNILSLYSECFTKLHLSLCFFFFPPNNGFIEGKERLNMDPSLPSSFWRWENTSCIKTVTTVSAVQLIWMQSLLEATSIYRVAGPHCLFLLAAVVFRVKAFQASASHQLISLTYGEQASEGAQRISFWKLIWGRMKLHSGVVLFYYFSFNCFWGFQSCLFLLSFKKLNAQHSLTVKGLYQ